MMRVHHHLQRSTYPRGDSHQKMILAASCTPIDDMGYKFHPRIRRNSCPWLSKGLHIMTYHCTPGPNGCTTCSANETTQDICRASERAMGTLVFYCPSAPPSTFPSLPSSIDDTLQTTSSRYAAALLCSALVDSREGDDEDDGGDDDDDWASRDMNIPRYVLSFPRDRPVSKKGIPDMDSLRTRDTPTPRKRRVSTRHRHRHRHRHYLERIILHAF